MVAGPARGRQSAGRAVRGGHRHGTVRSQRRFGRHRHRLGRRRRHARQRALPERRQVWCCSKQASATRSKTSSTTNGIPSSSSPGSTSAPPPGPGGSPKTSRIYPLGPARPWAAPPPTGQARRCASKPHEFRVRTEYGDIAGANLLDWPLTYEEMDAVLHQGRGQDGRHPDPRHPRACPATTTSR